MFVYYYVTLAAPYGVAQGRLARLLDGLGETAGAAYREGEELRVRIGPGLDRQLVAKTVRLMVGRPVETDPGLVVPLVWEATGARILFPRMEGDLVLASLGPDLSQLTFRGSYRPPLGALGAAVDRTVLHRVAEASVRNFVERIAAQLTAEVALSGRAAPPTRDARTIEGR
jgi:hypothetical protein